MMNDQREEQQTTYQGFHHDQSEEAPDTCRSRIISSSVAPPTTNTVNNYPESLFLGIREALTENDVMLTSFSSL